MNEIVYRNAREDFGDEYMWMYPESRAKVQAYRDKTKGRFAMAVKSVTIVVTEDCNLRCSYCYQHDKNCDHRMTQEMARQIVDTLFEEDAKNNLYLNTAIAQAIILDFIGGEPLLEIELISYFMRYFKWKAVLLNHRWAIHYMISISSNGTLYNTPGVQKFMAIHRGRVSLGITLDGNKELHDTCRRYPDGQPSYDIVAANVKGCQRDFDQSRQTKLTLAPANIMHLCGAVKNLYKTFDFEGVHANCVYEKGWTNEHAQVMYEQMKQLGDWMLDEDVYKTFYCSLFNPIIGMPMEEDDNLNWCGGTGCMLAFSTEGYITPCLRYLRFNLNDAQPEMRIGDLETGIANAPRYRAVIEKLDSITRRSQSTDECFNCPIASGCGWCSAYNYEVFGTPNKRATFICPTHKARVLANVYYWNKLYRKHGLNDRFPMNVPREWALEIVSEDTYEALMVLAKDD